ncbi:DUF2939 domain-containing protein [Thiorhodococcus mannitoliphagus]|uniref:DUF2939 domain-containing protein n=1 Tax=Thiorhodococcus mannitoliphagus TaxID=329406 RepID=A0A6P1DSP4_9GAMM|nr:DUF2939 domain-containing protein [Thiorhodococcus mannitoliphagus]NEX20829.1 DUF2939 domain-containing protein [Thiorhodococcus mannitoliphagus]
MARIAGFLLAFCLIVFGVWPYYSLYRLDQALSEPDASAIAPFVDLGAIQQSYKARLSSGVDTILPTTDRAAVPGLEWLAKSLRELGDQALGQVITLDLVRSMLREAAIRATDQRPVYFLAGVDYAFFASWNRFRIRLGDQGEPTEVLMRLEGIHWRITDIRD